MALNDKCFLLAEADDKVKNWDGLQAILSWSGVRLLDVYRVSTGNATMALFSFDPSIYLAGVFVHLLTVASTDSSCRISLIERPSSAKTK